MLVLGTVDYVKKEFGMGYVLTIASKGSENIHILENMKEKMIESIKKQIKEAKLIESQSTNKFFKVLLPFHSQKELVYLFEELEKFERQIRGL